MMLGRAGGLVRVVDWFGQVVWAACSESSLSPSSSTHLWHLGAEVELLSEPSQPGNIHKHE